MNFIVTIINIYIYIYIFWIIYLFKYNQYYNIKKFYNHFIFNKIKLKQKSKKKNTKIIHSNKEYVFFIRYIYNIKN